MDTAHQRKINALIPEAEKIAIQGINKLKSKFEIRPGIDGRTYRHCFRTELFHGAMNKLAFQAGLRPWN